MEINSGGIGSNSSVAYPDKGNTAPVQHERNVSVPVVNSETRTPENTAKEQLSEKKLSRDDLEKELDSLNKWLQSKETHLKFTLHEKLNEYYVQIVNDATREVIREIPSKKVMDMAAKMNEMLGLLIDERR